VATAGVCAGVDIRNNRFVEQDDSCEEL
jgi:hypothetical protein